MGIATMVIGFSLLAVGALLVIPLPELGLPLVLVSLRLLGRHFAWAQRANDKLEIAVSQARARWKTQPTGLRIAVLVLLLVGVGAAIAWVFFGR